LRDDFASQFSEPVVTEYPVLRPSIHLVGLAQQASGTGVLVAFPFVMHTTSFWLMSAAVFHPREDE
jgi:hypothetical protein